MRQILIDGNMLANFRIRRKNMSTGIPRVTLAYLEYFIEEMQIIFHYRSWIIILPKDISYKIGLLMINPASDSFRKLLKLFAQGIIKNFFTSPKEKKYLLTPIMGFKA